MRDEHRHPAARQLREPQEHFVLGARVERRGRLVEDQDLGVAHVGPAQRHLLPLAPRQLYAAVEAAAEHLVVALPEPGGDRVGEAAARGLADPRLVAQLLHLAHPDVLLEDEVVAHEVLEDDPDVLTQTVELVLPQVHPVEQDASLIRVVQAGQQLHERRLARPVLTHEGDPLARLEREGEVPHRPPVRARVAKSHVLELESPHDRQRHDPRPGPGRNPRLHVEEGEQVRQIQALLEHLRQRQEDALDQVAALAERAREERERADREAPQHREIDRHRVGAVVAERADGDEQRRDDVAPDREPFVLLVEVVRQLGVPSHEEVRQVEQLDLLRHLVRRARVPQVVEQPPLGSPAEQQRIAQRRVVRLAEERGQYRDDEQQQQPRELDEQHARERRQRHEILRRGEQQGDQSDPAHRLAAGALQMVVGLGILVLRQVERGRMLHQPHADAVREQVAEQALEQRRQPGEPFSRHGDAQLEPHEPAQVPPVHRRPPPAGRAHPHRGDHPVDDQLADPQDREGHERADRPQHENRHGVAAVGLVHELQQRGDVLQRLEPLAPGGGLPIGPGEQAPGLRHDAVRDEAGRGIRHNLNLSTGPCVNITA